jgi:hypothetical protein
VLDGLKCPAVFVNGLHDGKRVGRHVFFAEGGHALGFVGLAAARVSLVDKKTTSSQFSAVISISFI